MKTYPLGHDDAPPFAFEIDHTFVSRGTIVRLVKRVDGVTDVHRAGLFRSSDDVRVAFKYLGRDYIVWEPWGDNSRYWVGPRVCDGAAPPAPDIGRVRSVFDSHSVWPAQALAVLILLILLTLLRLTR